MSYEDRKKKVGPLGDPGDEPDYSEEEEFEICRDGGMAASDFSDPAKGKRYAEWLAANPAA